MNQAASDNELPSGLRSSIVYAVHTDDPEALLMHLDACSQVELSVLLTDQGGKVPVKKYDSPWTFSQVKQSAIMGVDNRLCDLLNFECGEHGTQASLFVLAFALAAEFGSMRSVTMLLSEKYRSHVNPAYLDQHALRMAINAGNAGVVKLLLSDDRVDPTTRSNQAISLATRYVCTYVYVCMHICMRVCMDVCMAACMYVWISISI
jgi:hypothetical protein